MTSAIWPAPDGPPHEETYVQLPTGAWIELSRACLGCHGSGSKLEPRDEDAHLPLEERRFLVSTCSKCGGTGARARKEPQS